MMEVMEPSKASEVVAERIRELIATGKLVAGAALPTETVLMQEHGVARPTMREALRILESDGLVEVHLGSRGGARVRPLDLEVLSRRAGMWLQANSASLYDLSEAGDLIEPGAAALAAERRSPAELDAFRDCAARALACTSFSEWADIAADMVQLLLTASGNKVLELFAQIVGRITREQFHARLDSRRRDAQLGEYATAYEKLVERIEARDGAGAAAVWQRLREDTDPRRCDSPDVAPPVTVYGNRKRRSVRGVSSSGRSSGGILDVR
jgi:GntR family transcriptional repressor for pyruvate dehydrogenase complex